jgi:hypothetical protein
MNPITRPVGQFVCDLIQLTGCASPGGKADIGYWTLVVAACLVIAAWAIRFVTKA